MKELTQQDKYLFSIKRIHMIGIGGSGMCPLAEILYKKGYQISGSDNNESDPLKRVRQFAEVSLGHKAENVNSAQLVVYSAAISYDNVELQQARKLNIPVMERSELLGALSRMYDNVIGVSGTHGKTTTTSMLTQILINAHKDPSAVIGGKLPSVDHYGVVGNSENLIVESCEFVDTFLHISEDIAVLLNIDNDHLDYFKTMDNLVNSFHKFVSRAKVVFVNGDDQLAVNACQNIASEVITFGESCHNDYYFTEAQMGKLGYSFSVYHKQDKIGSFQLHIPGRHNIYNALAAIAVSDYLSIDSKDIQSAFDLFTGAARRFQFIGEFGFTLVDDYGHHPTEIRATLSAAKQLNYKRVICVFQPFTYSRTASLLKEFAEVLQIADEIILSEIMGSREVNTYNIYSSDLQKLISKPCVVIEDFNAIKDYLIQHYQKGDLVITMGCGDIYKVAHLIEDHYKK
ncbi:MAG: UDP-N-acetylmuramate--L-alanine ligase [Erysipelotrichaceae bacterium]